MRKLLIFLLFSLVFGAGIQVIRISSEFEGCIQKISFENATVFSEFPYVPEFTDILPYFQTDKLICFSAPAGKVYVYYGESLGGNFSCNYTSFNGKILCYEKYLPNISIVKKEGNFNIVQTENGYLITGESPSNVVWANLSVNISGETIIYYEGSAEIDGIKYNGSGYAPMIKGQIYIEKTCNSSPCSVEFKIYNFSKTKGYFANIVTTNILMEKSSSSCNVGIKVPSIMEGIAFSNEISMKVKQELMEGVAFSNEISMRVEWGTWIIYDNVTLDSKVSVYEPLMVRHEIYTEQGEGIVEWVEEKLPKDIYLVNSPYNYTEWIEGDYRVIRFYLNETINTTKRIIFAYYITTNKSGEFDILLGRIKYVRETKEFELAPHWYHISFINPEENPVSPLSIDEKLPESVFKGEKGRIYFFIDESKLGTPEEIIVKYVDGTAEKYSLTPHGGGEYSVDITVTKYGPASILLETTKSSILLQRVHVNRIKNLNYQKIKERYYKYTIPSEDLSELENIKRIVGPYTIYIFAEVPEEILKKYRVYGAMVEYGNGTKTYVKKIVKIEGKLYVVFEDDPNPPYYIYFITAARSAPTLLPG